MGVAGGTPLRLEGAGWPRGAIVVDAGETAGFSEMPAGEDVEGGDFFHSDFKYRLELLSIGVGCWRVKAKEQSE